MTVLFVAVSIYNEAIFKKGFVMYQLQPARKERNPIWLVAAILTGIAALPVAYALLLIIGAFLKGFLGL